jgi:hypothetical protein
VASTTPEVRHLCFLLGFQDLPVSKSKKARWVVLDFVPPKQHLAHAAVKAQEVLREARKSQDCTRTWELVLLAVWARRLIFVAKLLSA